MERNTYITMKIDKLIKELQHIKEEYGNLKVQIPDKNHGLRYDSIKTVEKSCTEPNNRYQIVNLDT